MGNFPGSSRQTGASSRTTKSRLNKISKRLKKFGRKDNCTGQSSESETIDTVQTDTGLAAWQACAGSVVLSTAISVINFTTHEAVRSLNEDFRDAYVSTANPDEPVSTPQNLDCYSGIRQFFSQIVNIYPGWQNVISSICNPGDLNNEGLHQCLLRNYLEYHTSTQQVNDYCVSRTAQREFLYYYPCLFYNEVIPPTNGTTLFVNLCSNLWPPADFFYNSSNPQTSRLIAVENLFSASLHTADDEKLFGDTLNYVFVSLGLSFVLVGAVISVYCGYRVVSIIGSILVAVGFFFATFIDTDDGAPVQILVGGIAGIGSAFLRLSAVVAVLEYFKELRMRAIVFSGLGAVLINFLLIGITFINDAEFYWKTVFRFQLFSAVLSLIISFIMKPVLLVSEAVEKPLDELRDRIEEKKDEITCITKLSEYVFTRELFTNKVFYLVLGLYFFDQLGRPIFTEGVQPLIIERNYEDNELKVKVQPLVENIGALIGLGVLLLITKKQSKIATLQEARKPALILQDLALNVTILAVLNTVVGLLCMHMPTVKSYPLTLVYSAVFGFTEGMFNSLVQDFVPDGFGRRHIRMMAGFLGFVAGIGSVIAGAVADGMQQNAPNPNSAFYFCGVCLLISGTISIVTRFIVMRDIQLRERLKKEHEKEKHRQQNEKRDNKRVNEANGNTEAHVNQAVSTEDIEISIGRNNQHGGQTVSVVVEDPGSRQQDMPRMGERDTDSMETEFNNYNLEHEGYQRPPETPPVVSQ